MNRALLLLALAITATPSMATAQRPAGAAAAPSPSPDAMADRRILVMLRLAPEHYDPGTDYGGGYGDPTSAQARRRLAARIARKEGLRLETGWPMPILGIDCMVMIVPEGRSLEGTAERISHLSGVAWSQPLHRYATQGQAPAFYNDRLFRAQPATRGWQLAALHRMATGNGITVAIIDSGIDAGHPDLRGQLMINRDFVADAATVGAETHGTGVAGIIGARANNAVGIAGIAPGARLMGLRACWQPGGTAGTICDTLSLAKALTFAIERKARVVNLSLTGPFDQLLARLVQVGIARGVAFVAAVDPETGSGFPAALPGVVAVADDGVAGTRTGVYIAPGRDVPTTEPGGRWYLVSGNSYAAAHVSGLMALMQELRPGKTGQSFVSARSGGGVIDACDTLQHLARSGSARCSVPN